MLFSVAAVRVQAAAELITFRASTKPSATNPEVPPAYPAPEVKKVAGYMKSPRLLHPPASSRKCRRHYPGSLQMPAPVTIADNAQAHFRDDVVKGARGL
jgi:hypothetical protein